MTLQPETVAAIRSDEFASKAIDAARSLIYAHFRDWAHVNVQGKLIFTDDNAATAYLALSMLLDTDQTPDMGDAVVDIGGTDIPVKALDELTAAFRRS